MGLPFVDWACAGVAPSSYTGLRIRLDLRNVPELRGLGQWELPPIA